MEDVKMPDHNPQVLSLRWRVGSKNHRTVYAQLGDAPSLVDVRLGMMDSEELAQECVNRHNAYGIGMYTTTQRLDDAMREVQRLRHTLEEAGHTHNRQVAELQRQRGEIERLRRALDANQDQLEQAHRGWANESVQLLDSNKQLRAAVERAGFEVLEGDFVLRDGTKTRLQLRVRAASTVLRQVGAWLDSQVMGGLEAVVNARTGEPVGVYTGKYACNCGVDTVGNQNHLPNCPAYRPIGGGTGSDC